MHPEITTADSLGHNTRKLPTPSQRQISQTPQNGDPTLSDLVDHAGELLPDRRVSWCGKLIIKGQHSTTVQYNADQKRARFTHLAKCGDPACLRCAIARAEQDKCEVSWAVSDSRLLPILGTFTASHNTSDNLREWGEKFDQALRGMNSARFQERLKNVYGLRYDIWARDHTAGGLNGHHQHRGQIFFLDPQVLAESATRDGVTIDDEIKEFEVEMRLQFEKCLAKTGLHASYSRGFVVSAKEHDISEYIASHGRIPKAANMEWDIQHELTLSAKKHDHKGQSKHPFELLVESYHGNKRSRALFIEWARFMYRKHSVNWSKGARKYFLSGERPYSDDQHPDKVGTWDTVLSLPKEVFYILLKLKLIAAFLFHIVEAQGDEIAAREWLKIHAGLVVERIDLSQLGMNSPPGRSGNGNDRN